jgi:ferritin-like metal-binding protein YciE
MKAMKSMKDLFMHELGDLYHAENQLLKTLPRISERVSSEELKSALKEHTEETKEHVHRLEECFKQMGEKTSAHECQAMQGIIAEAEEILAQEEDGELIDAALIGAAQKVEHYEIAGYGTVTEWAKTMGQNEVARILGQTLSEEEKADGLLTKLARGGINQGAIKQ